MAGLIKSNPKALICLFKMMVTSESFMIIQAAVWKLTFCLNRTQL